MSKGVLLISKIEHCHDTTIKNTLILRYRIDIIKVFKIYSNLFIAANMNYICGNQCCITVKML